ncbi:MAG: helix-turn-helix domain-containing protein [Sandaracinaceae bacterium]
MSVAQKTPVEPSGREPRGEDTRMETTEHVAAKEVRAESAGSTSDAAKPSAERSVPTDSEPADSEPADSEPADSEPAEAKPAEAKPAEAKPKARAKSTAGTAGRRPNNVRKMRVERMMSKAELARRAGLSVLTIDRVEKGYGCRMDTKRKILRALDLSLGDRVRVFGEEE